MYLQYFFRSCFFLLPFLFLYNYTVIIYLLLDIMHIPLINNIISNCWWSARRSTRSLAFSYIKSMRTCSHALISINAQANNKLFSSAFSLLHHFPIVTSWSGNSLAFNFVVILDGGVLEACFLFSCMHSIPMLLFFWSLSSMWFGILWYLDKFTPSKDSQSC